MTFAEKLKTIRKQAGFSQERLAEKLGVFRQAITKWETEGTPFTEGGAKSIFKLGILFIVVSVLSAAFSSAMEKFSFISERIDNGSGIIIGLILIFFAMIVRYGAELEKQNRV